MWDCKFLGFGYISLRCTYGTTAYCDLIIVDPNKVEIRLQAFGITKERVDELETDLLNELAKESEVIPSDLLEFASSQLIISPIEVVTLAEKIELESGATIDLVGTEEKFVGSEQTLGDEVV